MALDPIAQAIVDAMSAQFPDLGGRVTDASTARATLAAAPRPPAPDVPLRRVEDRQVTVPGAPPIPVRVYWPNQDGPLPAIVFFHGGGFVLSSVDGHDAFARKLAIGADAVVVSVEYRLAPEHRYPAAVEDAVAATAWMFDNAGELGIDPARIAVAGDSAGGNLAAVVCLTARDHGGPPLAAQVLIYPVLDARQDSDSHRRNATGYFLTSAHMKWFWEQYLDGADPDHPDVSPVRASDLTGLPPAVIVVAEHDVLADDGRFYAALLSEAHNDVELLDYRGMFHGFFGLVAQLPTAQQANNDVFTALKRLWATKAVAVQPDLS
ncbi:acetyl esterase [Mycolicibacterium moriokaense]|uniref:Acetyl esterase n=1 Tax=Mycolicibacterium moriokaense TaxID=39691 RepID=A0A318H8M8_9MYCO|nr:acetyl esterase [Mycolicibacterium moriokaense]